MRLAVLGAGPGGYVAALKAAQLGAEVTVIEDREVGGTCLNWGCIPTKTLIASAEMLVKTRELDAFGIDLKGTVLPNLAKIMERKSKVVSTQVKGIRGLFKSWGITLREGRGIFLSPREIGVALRDGSRESVSADRIIIATGSRPAEIPDFPCDGRNILSSTDALELSVIPRSMLIIGAGVIGCEFACIYSAFGTEVVLVEMMDRAVATEDLEVSELLAKELKKRKIKLLTGTGVERIGTEDDGVHAFLSGGRELVVEKVLVSVGRTMNSDDLGLENAGIEMGPRNTIAVNSRMETNVPGIYAVGDVTGGLLLAHVASREGIVAAKNAMGGSEVMDSSIVPAAIFTSPEIASVGLREQQAVAMGMGIRIGRFQFRMLGKAHAMGEIAGFIKIIADEESDRVLGAHIVGPHASDLIHEVVIVMENGLTVRDMVRAIHAHPTLAEGLLEAAEDVHGEAIHVPRPPVRISR